MTLAARLLVDACILIKGNVSNVFFDMAQSGLVSLHWTPEIGEEFIRNWAIKRASSDDFKEGVTPQRKYESVIRANEEKARKRLSNFEAMQPEWRIPGWDLEKMSQAVPPERLRVGEAHGVHPKDYSVALAAIAMAQTFAKDEAWLVSENQKHLPPGIFKRYDVWSVNQGTGLAALFKDYPHAVMGSLLKTIQDTKAPRLSKEDMIGIVSSGSFFGVPDVARQMDQYWKVYDIPGKPRSPRPQSS